MKYSIITPTYNREDCIGRCIESVIRNISPSLDFEHIVVDDGSTDGTSGIIERYAQENMNIKFIKFEHNKGTNAARNAAISSAAGDFCIILDSDDYFAADALSIIDTTVNEFPQFSHYLFAPNDRAYYFNQNKLLHGKKTQILTFQDFLSGKITGDFIHVVKTSTLKKYPFDETLKIFEGVFFLKFYKEAGQILFTNQIVTIRERNRTDSVSKDFIRTSVDIIKRTIKSGDLWMKWFEGDCVKLGVYNLLIEKYTNLLENHLLVSDYISANNDIAKINKYKGDITPTLKLVYALRCGAIYRLMLQVYLKLKYNVFRVKLRS